MKALSENAWKMRRMRLTNKVAKALRGNSQGVGLIEVLIGLAILGAIAAALLGGVTTAFKADIIADERSTAQSLAQSQMEYVKSQNYISAPQGGAATYLKIVLSEYPGYLVKSVNRAGNTVDSIVGVPWNTGTGQQSYTDDRIQKVTIVVEHNSEEVLRLEDYKVDR